MKEMNVQSVGDLAMGALLPAKLPEPGVAGWVYEVSVEVSRTNYSGAKRHSALLVAELKRAYDELAKPGNPYRRTKDGVVKKLTFSDYCSDVGIHPRTAKRLIERYMSETEIESEVRPEPPYREKIVCDSDSPVETPPAQDGCLKTSEETGGASLHEGSAEDRGPYKRSIVFGETITCPHCGMEFSLPTEQEAA